MACNRCKADRSESQWCCAECDNLNYLDRTECNRCRAPAPQGQFSSHEQAESDSAALLQAIQAFDPQFTGDRYFNGDGYDNIGLLKELDVKVGQVRSRHSGARNSGAHRRNSAPSAPPPNRAFSGGRRFDQRQQFAQPVGGRFQGGSRVQDKPGSWECTACANWNFADRQECNRCKEPKVTKPVYRGQGDVSRKPGSWLCSVCPSQWNFPDREACNKCKRPREEVEASPQ